MSSIAVVVFSEAPHGPYDYRIPDALRETLAPGMRVHVPLGRLPKTSVTVGWCIETRHGAAAQRSLRDVAEVIDEEPLV